MLLVDEPTSGLDSANAKSVVDALARVARSGRVVVMSIHQVATCSSDCSQGAPVPPPRLAAPASLTQRTPLQPQPRSYIWSQFDGLLLLGKKGEILYCSSRERCLEHFAAQGFQAPSVRALCPHCQRCYPTSRPSCVFVHACPPGCCLLLQHSPPAMYRTTTLPTFYSTWWPASRTWRPRVCP